MKILLTGACGVTSRAVARAIRMSPEFGAAALIGTDIGDNIYGYYEGLYQRIYRVPHSRDASYSQHIARICEAEGIDVAIVIPELEVLYWTEHSMPVPALLPPPGFSRVAVSKRNLYARLDGTGLVPDYAIVSREDLIAGAWQTRFQFPFWIRDFSEGGTSGRGALQVERSGEVEAWATLNHDISHFMVSEFLPGRNFACTLLYHDGVLLKVGMYERLEYFMAKTTMSGISGNISRGRLVNEPTVREASEAAIARVLEATGERMHGLVTVDLREARDGRPMVTEINLRHVAATSSFAMADFNLVEAQLHAALGDCERVGPVEIIFPTDNYILRDIDGVPVWVAEHHPPAIGESIDSQNNKVWEGSR